MDALPLELYLSIFDYLDLSDLLTMRLVCKRIESAVREFRVQEFTCLEGYFYGDYFKFAHDWFSSDEAKEQRMLFPFSGYLLSRGPCNVQFLKRLRISSFRVVKGIDLKEIARFQNLECLEIGFDLESQQSFSLSLPNLRALRIEEFLHKEKLEIVAPKLQALHLPKLYDFFRRYKLSREEYLTIYLPRLTFRHPQSVRFLSFHEDYLSQSHNIQPHEPYLDQFESLDCMEIEHEEDLAFECNYLDPNGMKDRVVRLDQVLLKFPSLKRIHFTAGNGYVKRTTFAKLTAQLKDLKQLKTSERPDLKLYYMNIELSDDPVLIEDFEKFRKTYQTLQIYAMRIRDRRWLTRLNEKLILQLSHYWKLEDTVSTAEWIDYNKLEDWFESVQLEHIPAELIRAGPSSGLPIDFFKRFPCIRGIRVTSRISDPNALAFFVKNCKKLKEFSSSGSELSQTFFGQLPAVSSLNFLEIEEASDLNMQFLLRMNRLVGLKTNQQLTAEIARYFFGMRFGHRLLGKLLSNSVETTRYGRSSFFSLNVNGETTKERLTFECLIEQFRSLEKGQSSDDGPPLKIFKSSSVGSSSSN